MAGSSVICEPIKETSIEADLDSMDALQVFATPSETFLMETNRVNFEKTRAAILARCALMEETEGKIENTLSLLRLSLEKLQTCLETIDAVNTAAGNNAIDGQIRTQIQKVALRLYDRLSQIEHFKQIKEKYSSPTASTVKQSQDAEKVTAFEKESVASKNEDKSLLKKEVIKAEFKKKISQESQGQQITWEDIIGYADVKNEIKTTFVSSRRHNFSTAAFKIPALRYMALFGPAGVGKTMFIFALSSELGFPLLTVVGSDIEAKYIGQNLVKLNCLFEVAKEDTSKGLIIFFDEVETLLPDRNQNTSRGSQQLVTEFLNQHNALEEFLKAHPERDIIIIMASNYPEKIDKAVWRRMQKFIHLPLPSDEDRISMLKNFMGETTFKMLDEEKRTILKYLVTNFTPADLKGLANDIKLVTFRQTISATHFKWYCGPLPTNPTSIGQGWQPCNPNDVGAIAKSMQEIAAAELVLPAVRARDILLCAKVKPPSLNVNDPEGSVSQCSRFAKEFAQSCDIRFDFADQTEKFDYEALNKEAKKYHDIAVENARAATFKGAKEGVMATELKVQFHNGRLVPFCEREEDLIQIVPIYDDCCDDEANQQESACQRMRTFFTTIVDCFCGFFA